MQGRTTEYVMEGSPVRGPQRWRKTWIGEARDVQTYQSELIRIIASELANVEVVFGRVEEGSNSLVLPAWIKTHLDRHPALYRKLSQGDVVGIGHADQPQASRLAAAVRSSILI